MDDREVEVVFTCLDCGGSVKEGEGFECPDCHAVFCNNCEYAMTGECESCHQKFCNECLMVDMSTLTYICKECKKELDDSTY